MWKTQKEGFMDENDGGTMEISSRSRRTGKNNHLSKSDISYLKATFRSGAGPILAGDVPWYRLNSREKCAACL